MGNSSKDGKFTYKMLQAREAYDEAQGLLADNAELRYVMNSLYYAFYYPVLGLLHLAGSGPAMQSVSIALFEKLFAGTGIIDNRFFPKIRRAFNLKPKCTETTPKLYYRADIEALLPEARNFYQAVDAAAEKVKR